MLLRSAATQLRVVHALVLRETKTRFGREQLGYIWALIEPMLWISVFVTLFSLRGRQLPSGMPLVYFLMTGFVAFGLYRNTVMRTMGAIQSNRALLYFPQVHQLTLVTARAVLEYTTTALVFLLLLIGASLLDEGIRIDDPLGVIVWFSMFSITGLGFGLICSTLSPMFATVERLVPGLVLRPLFFTSGLFFTAEMLPPGAREIALINPLLHSTELLRSAFFVEFDSSYGDPSYVISIAVFQIAFGLLLQRALSKRVLLSARQL